MTDLKKHMIVSSRVRLARNIRGIPFPFKMSPFEAATVTDKVYNALKSTGDYTLYRLSELSDIECLSLKERYLISNDLIKNRSIGSVILNPGETVAVMVNEEDHIRAQCVISGFDLNTAYKEIKKVDDALNSSLDLAYDNEFGYITSCPTNLGTGLRASALCFLPCLSTLNNLEQVVKSFAHINAEIRGVYGEGTKAAGYLYQVSNKTTLGVSEEELVEDVRAMVLELAEKEVKARERVLNMCDPDVIDNIMRSYGILTNAYKLTTEEFMSLSADVRMGACLGYTSDIDEEVLNTLLLDVQPATLIIKGGKNYTAEERDIARAALVKRMLNKNTEV